MGRRLLAGLLVAVVSSLSPLASARAAAIENCACIKAACCCAPKRPASGHGCHGEPSDASHSAAMRCHHTNDTLGLTSTTGALPAPIAVRPALRREPASSIPAAAPRDGFSRLYAPPPRLLAS